MAAAFQNLYRLLDPLFSDFNQTTFLGRHEYVPGDYIEQSLGRAFRSGDRTELDPSLIETFELTLSPASCQAFFRANPQLPFIERDYYLSKVFQFVYAALRSEAFTFSEGSLGKRLEAVLAKTPAKLLPLLHDLFSIEQLFIWSLAHRDADDNTDLLKTLDGHAFLIRQKRTKRRPAVPQRSGRRVPDRRLAKARKMLWTEYRQNGGSAKQLGREVHGVDHSQLSHWRSGELPDSSSVSSNIKNAIEGHLSKKKDIGGTNRLPPIPK